MTAVLDRDGIWQAIDVHLCEGWTVRDIAGHLTMPQVSLGEVVRMIVKARGDTDRAIRDSARERAAELWIDQVVARSPGSGPWSVRVGTMRASPVARL